MDERLKRAIGKLGVTGYVPGSSATRGWLYNPLPFPGCEGLPCHRPNSQDRWALIAQRTNFKDARVLDMGCATGFFSFKSVQAGAAAVLGVDHDPAAIEVCRAAAATFNVPNVRFECASAPLPTESYDVIFAMSVLNWMGRERAEELLSSPLLDRSVVWVEIPLKRDGRSGASWLGNDDDIRDWLQEFFSNVDYAGRTYGTHCRKWRSLWMAS